MQRHFHANEAFALSIAALVLLDSIGVVAQTPQEHVHNMSHSVMPFDMAKTVHIFKVTESGGVQRVLVKDKSYADQVILFQKHLREEALTAIHRWFGAV